MCPHAAIRCIATYAPAAVLTNEDLAARFGRWSAADIFAKTGILERHIAGAQECASDLAFSAAMQLIDDGRLDPSSVDALLFCTQTPDYVLPPSACVLQDRLGLPRTVLAFDYNLGCSGYVVGLSLAKGLVETGQARTVLLLTADTYSKLVHPMDRSVCTLFGDGASATLLTATDDVRPGLDAFVFGTDGRGAHQLMVPSGGCRIPRSCETSAATMDADGNVRTGDHLYMNGREVFRFAITTVPRMVADVMARSGVTQDEVDYLVMHQANRYMLEELIRKMAWPPSKVPVRLEHFGNTVSSTIPFVLDDLVHNQLLVRGKVVLLVGFGVGYSWAGCSVVWA